MDAICSAPKNRRAHLDVRELCRTGGPDIASSNKRKTTIAKLNRERRLVERRLDKQARKAARKQAAADQSGRTADTPTDNEA
jgi:hypothetical protein